jgi:prepilin-type N-terminal cleavage/methylation domain-containing protein
MKFSSLFTHVRGGAQKRGFTLIELLVVIAIIGILSSVVLASLNTARNKGADAAIKGDLAGVRATAEVLYDTLGNKYGPSSGTTVAGACTRTDASSIFADTNVQQALGHAATSNGGTDGQCNLAANGSAYAISFALKTTGQYWCIDSTGVSRGATTGGTAYTGLTGASPAAIATGGTACQ